MALASDVVQLVARVPVDRPELADLEVGQPVTVPVGESELAATIQHVDVGDGEGAGGGTIVATFNEQPDRSLVGGNVLVVARFASTDGAVLTVPVTAVQSDAAGNTYVHVLDVPEAAVGAGEVHVVPGGVPMRRVDVRVGFTGEEAVEVVPLQAGTLSAGQRVVLGAG